MKFGMRKPSFKKSFSARTTGRAKRQLMRAIFPSYGKRGMGWRNPKRALYNRLYYRSTFSIFDKPKNQRVNNSGCLGSFFSNSNYTIKPEATSYHPKESLFNRSRHILPGYSSYPIQLKPSDTPKEYIIYMDRKLNDRTYESRLRKNEETLLYLLEL